MPRTDQAQTMKLHSHVHVASETPVAPLEPTNRHIEFHGNREVRAGVIMQIGGQEIPLTGLEFFRLLLEAKSYAQDWGSGDRPSRADIREAIRKLKAGGQ